MNEEDKAVVEQSDEKFEMLTAPMKGEVIALSDVHDEAFSSGVLGPGLAIVPSEGKLYAPCDGQISTFFPTGHAIGITTAKGAEVLIHVGMDTVQMNGEGFTPKKQQGEAVRRGELLLEFDINKIKEAGYETTTPIVITNSDNYSMVDAVSPRTIETGEDMIELA